MAHKGIVAAYGYKLIFTCIMGVYRTRANLAPRDNIARFNLSRKVKAKALALGEDARLWTARAERKFLDRFRGNLLMQLEACYFCGTLF